VNGRSPCSAPPPARLSCDSPGRPAKARRLLDSILLASPEERYEFFLTSVARGGAVWALHCEEGWLFGEAASGELIFPVWPSARAALGSAELLSHAPAAISSEEWIDVWLQCLACEQSQVGVFPTLTSPGTAVHPGILWAQLVERLP